MISICCKFLLALLCLSSGALLADSGAAFGSSGTSVWKLLFSLVFVVILIPVVLFGIKKLQGLQHKYGKTPIQVLSVQALGTKEKLVVVEIEQQRLLLGVTSQSISLLKTLSDQNVEFSQYLGGDQPELTKKTSDLSE